MSGNGFVDADGENVLITSGDVTTISSGQAAAASEGRDAVATGGDAIAANVSADGQMLNVAFMTGRGDAQIIQVNVGDLTRGRESAQRADAAPGGGAGAGAGSGATDSPDSDAAADAGDREAIIIAGDLTTLSGAAIAANAGAATTLTGISVAAELGDRGDLTLTFVDGDGDLQLIETNVAELLQG